jgi:PRTRC genetic system protein F
MLQLEDALQRAKGSKLFEHSQWAEPAYSAASIAVFSEEWIGELLDDHFECISNSGEATMYQVLIPLASDPQQVPKQYEDLSRMFEIVKALDQLLTIISR